MGEIWGRSGAAARPVPWRPDKRSDVSQNQSRRYTDAKSQGEVIPAMNAPSEMSFDEMLRVKLEVLRREHRDLDEAIHALETTGRPDQLTLRRLKKQKLLLKDAITRIEDQLIPDIIA